MENNNLLLNGTWEKENKNVVVAAIISVFMCGGLYFFFPSIILGILQAIDLRTGDFSKYANAKDYFDFATRINERYKYLVLIATGISQYVFFLGLNIYITRRWHTTNIAEYFQYKKFNFVFLLVAIIGAISLVPIADLFSSLVYRIFPIFEKISDTNKPLLTAGNTHDLILILAVIALTPAICEEALFRGYFQRTLQRKIPYPWHFILSGCVFGLYHRQVLNLPVLMLVGIWLGFLYYTSGSIYPSMAAHCVYNATIVVMLNYQRLFSFFLNEKGGFTIPVIIVSVFVFTGSISLFILKHKHNTA
jgi:membrane protease YdiL (CAAX protease family)